MTSSAFSDLGVSDFPPEPQTTLLTCCHRLSSTNDGKQTERHAKSMESLLNKSLSGFKNPFKKNKHDNQTTARNVDDSVITIYNPLIEP